MLVRDAKELARRNPFESAGDIIDKVLNDRRETLKGHEAVAPKMLARRINRDRVRRRQSFHESTCKAQITKFVYLLYQALVLSYYYQQQLLIVNFSSHPDADIFNHKAVIVTAGNSVVRHDVYMTNTQRHHTASATIWFEDATFQPAGDGFRQLFTINCFIEAKDGEVTQIPVTFAFMKRKRQ